MAPDIALAIMASAAKISAALSLLVLALAWSASARKLLQSSSSAAICYVQLEQNVCVVAFTDVSGTQCNAESQQSGMTLEGDGENCFVPLPIDCSDAVASFTQSTSYQVPSCGDSLTSEVQANSDSLVQAAGKCCRRGSKHNMIVAAGLRFRMTTLLPLCCAPRLT